MPPTVSKSPLFAKYGARLDKAVRTHATDPTEVGGFSRLPPGINNGIAQVVKCKFEQYKADTKMKKADGGSAAGEYYLSCTATVIEPYYVDVKQGDGVVQVKAYGQFTTLSINGISPPVFDTANRSKEVTTQEMWIAKILNEFRKLCGDEFTANASGANLEELAAAIEQAGPYTRFSTSQSEPTKEYPNPRVWENWNGSEGLADYTPPAVPGMQTDHTGAPSANGAPAGEAPTETPTTGGSFDEFADLDSLVTRAGEDSDDGEAARQQLKDMALAAGITEEEVEGADSWQTITDLIVAAQSAAAGGEGAPAEEPEPATAQPWTGPKKEEIYKYQPTDPKTKKPMVNPRTKKPLLVECEVTAVDAKGKACTLKSIDDQTVFKGVKYTELRNEDGSPVAG